MAQDYVGSNNLNLLVPSGQFGTRLAGGADAASPRYIFTHLAPATRYLFPEDDDVLLDYLEDDGQLIEPKFYCPIIPLLLVNGSQGIGTGWSTFIPPHHPMSVLDYIRSKLDGTVDPPKLKPYANGFRGTIERLDTDKGYISQGLIKKLDIKTVQIDELPIGTWTNKYKAHLIRMQSNGIISDIVENHTTTKVSFLVKLKPSQLKRMEESGLEKAFKLRSNLLLTNMNAFDEMGNIRKFESAEAIADAYFPIRLSLYHDRKSVLQSKMEYSASKQRNKARFIQMVSDGQIDLVGGRITKDEASMILAREGFSTARELEAVRNNNSLAKKQETTSSSEDTEAEFDEDSGESQSDFDYLLKMPLSSLTKERIESLNQEAKKIEDELDAVRGTTPEELWMTDLEKLARHL